MKGTISHDVGDHVQVFLWANEEQTNVEALVSNSAKSSQPALPF
jgi:hypothetical protein